MSARSRWRRTCARRTQGPRCTRPTRGTGHGDALRRLVRIRRRRASRRLGMHGHPRETGSQHRRRRRAGKAACTRRDRRGCTRSRRRRLRGSQASPRRESPQRSPRRKRRHLHRSRGRRPRWNFRRVRRSPSSSESVRTQATRGSSGRRRKTIGDAQARGVAQRARRGQLLTESTRVPSPPRCPCDQRREG